MLKLDLFICLFLFLKPIIWAYVGSIQGLVILWLTWNLNWENSHTHHTFFITFNTQIYRVQREREGERGEDSCAQWQGLAVLWIKLKLIATLHKTIQTFNTPPQAGAYKSYAPSLEHIDWILVPFKDLVKISAGLSLELMNSVIISLDNNFSQMKWQSISMCLVL